MNIILTMAIILALTIVSENSFAGCNCDDWMDRGGYCVDYVKTRIPAFPIPKTDSEITGLNNRDVSKVEEGDVAIFDLGRYWHVAYVEKVHTDNQGSPTTIDVSEMNYGGQLSFDEYTKRWRAKDEGEWMRAVCCGVTKRYDQRSTRRNIALESVGQIWSPEMAAAQQNCGLRRDGSLLGRVREALNQIIQFTGRSL